MRNGERLEEEAKEEGAVVVRVVVVRGAGWVEAATVAVEAMLVVTRVGMEPVVGAPPVLVSWVAAPTASRETRGVWVETPCWK